MTARARRPSHDLVSQRPTIRRRIRSQMPKPLVISTVAALIVLAAMTAVVRSNDVSPDAPAAPPAPAVATPATAPAGEYHTTVLPLLQKYCYECHGDGMDSGDLEMDSYKSLQDLRADVNTWHNVHQYARTQPLPPPNATQPTQQAQHPLLDPPHPHLAQDEP